MAANTPPRDHRDDPRWQAHHAAYVADYPDLTPAAVMRTRIEAAHGMYLVEVEYLGDGRKPMSLLEGVRRAFRSEEPKP